MLCQSNDKRNKGFFVFAQDFQGAPTLQKCLLLHRSYAAKWFFEAGFEFAAEENDATLLF